MNKKKTLRDIYVWGSSAIVQVLKKSEYLQLDKNILLYGVDNCHAYPQQVGTVECALQIYLQLGLVKVMTNGAYYMSNSELLIGQSST